MPPACTGTARTFSAAANGPSTRTYTRSIGVSTLPAGVQKLDVGLTVRPWEGNP